MSVQPDAPALAGEIVRQVNDLSERSTSAMRKIRRDFSRRLRKAPAKEVVALAFALIGAPGVHRFIADELIVFHPTALGTLTENDIVRLAGALSTWDEVDCFALYLSGRAWRAGQVRDETIAEWTQATDRWWRRAALVSTVALNLKSQGGTGDPQRTLRICRLLVRDRDDMVVKAMSWALRALSVRDRAAVEAFLAEHQGQLASRVIREVENKLRTGLKNPSRALDRPRA